MRNTQIKMAYHVPVIGILVLAVMVIFVANLFYGSVRIPAGEVFHILMGGQGSKSSWEFIVWHSRLPQAVTAMLCGSSLAASGLLLQTYFHNPLAGPSILGITNGASLGVAIVMLVTGGVIGSATAGDSGLQLVGFVAVVVAAFIGAMVVIALLLFVTKFVRNTLAILILGIMVSYLTSSFVSLCNFFANAESVHTYVNWGMGSFSNVNLDQLPLFGGLCLAGLLIAILLVKPLNAILLGENYAANLGVNVQSTRLLILLSTGILTAITTAFCGPVAFIGLAVPHIARLVMQEADHRVLLPATILIGALIALLCNIICLLPQNLIIPLNAVTPIFGAPVIIYIIMRRQF